MSLIIRRKAGREGVSINGGEIIVRVVKVDPDGTVHLAFNAPRDVKILREELIEHEYLGDVRRQDL